MTQIDHEAMPGDLPGLGKLVEASDDGVAVALDGSTWRMQGFLGDSWAWVADGPLDRRPERWSPASVPGSVIHDLWRAGEVPDPYLDRQSRASEWAATRHWLYRRTFRFGTLLSGARARLLFQGVDHAADYRLDGRHLGTSRSQFAPSSFEVTDLLAGEGPAEHELLVHLEPAPPGEPQVGDSSRVRTHRTRMTEGWDFCPRIPHLGIWRPVALRLSGPVAIEEVWVRPRLDDAGAASLEVRVTASAVAEAAPAVQVRLVRQGAIVAEVSSDALRLRGRRELGPIVLEVDRPDRWWPNGAGEQALYQAQVTVLVDGIPSDRRSVPVGFRTVELVANEGAPAGALPYTLRVNGRRSFARGWDWVPMDAHLGVPRPALLAHLVDLAREARVNLLRVWGGGVIESHAFYDACDRAGILVWQEFVQSSSGSRSTPSSDRAFLELMADEARRVIPLVRNHPSLAIWCGGNELADADGSPLDERHPLLYALRAAVRRHDPDRAWLPTSPSGPTALFPGPADGSPDDLHDVHGPWEHQGLAAQRRIWGGSLGLFHSEFGAPGMTSAPVLDRTVSADHRWPQTRAQPVLAHRGDWWIDEPLVQASFGAGIDDPATLRRASRALQADGLRTAVEAIRSGWPRTSGSLPWQFDESFPNAWSTAAVDHSGRPKPAYHAVAGAYRETGVAVRVPTPAIGDLATLAVETWAWTEGSCRDAVIRLLARDASGVTLGEAAVGTSLDPDRVSGPHRLELGLRPTTARVVCLDAWIDGAGAHPEHRYLLARARDLGPLLRAPLTTLEAVAGTDGALRVRNTGPTLAIGIEPDDLPEDRHGVPAVALTGPLHLLPGESATLRIAWRAVPASERRCHVGAWNSEPVPVHWPT